MHASAPLAAATHERLRPTLAHLGGHPLACGLLAVHLLVLVLGLIGFWATGLQFKMSVFHVGMLVVVFVAWLVHVIQPGRKPADWATADALMALLLLLMFTNVASPLQYVAVALKQPLADPVLARADAMFGVHVPSIVEWTKARPTLTAALAFCYYTLLPQFFLPVLVIGLWHRDRQTLWEYVFHFHACAAVTIASLAIWPAACAFTFYGYESLLNQTRFIQQFSGFRAGSLTLVDAGNLEGLVSMPSFHIAGALMVTWAFRHYPGWLVLLVPINLMMMAATVMTGAHYFVDVPATFALFALSVAAYRQLRLSAQI
jgi:hypothetical protein